MGPTQPVATFSLKGCIIAVGGIDLSGFGDGDALKIESDGEAFAVTKGVDGTVVRASTGNHTAEGGLYKITLSLLQTSSYNAKMSSIFLTDTGSPFGLIVPFIFKDLGGFDKFNSSEFWVMGPPSMSRGNKVNNHDWPCMAKGKLFLGGQFPTPVGF